MEKCCYLARLYFGSVLGSFSIPAKKEIEKMQNKMLNKCQNTIWPRFCYRGAMWNQYRNGAIWNQYRSFIMDQNDELCFKKTQSDISLSKASLGDILYTRAFAFKFLFVQSSHMLCPSAFHFFKNFIYPQYVFHMASARACALWYNKYKISALNKNKNK